MNYASRYCRKHTCYYESEECSKCKAGEGPYLRKRSEVFSDKVWAEYVKLGWVEK